jgi:hypothetical protein
MNEQVAETAQRGQSWIGSPLVAPALKVEPPEPRAEDDPEIVPDEAFERAAQALRGIGSAALLKELEALSGIAHVLGALAPAAPPRVEVRGDITAPIDTCRHRWQRRGRVTVCTATCGVEVRGRAGRRPLPATGLDWSTVVFVPLGRLLPPALRGPGEA